MSALRMACGLMVLWLTAAAPAQGLRIVDNPALGTFVDVANFGGQPIPLGDDGEAQIGTFPGNFVFAPGLLVVGQNGGVGFGQFTVTDLAPLNQPIPSQGAFAGGQAALVFWDDIDDKEGDVEYVQLVGHPELSDRLIIQWNYQNFEGSGATLKFQAHILDNDQPTGIYAQFAYRIIGPAAGAGASATIGYQDDEAGFGDLQFSFNESAAVTNGTVLSLLIPQPSDLDGDGRVAIGDLLLLLATWGPCGPCAGCPADLDHDCAVAITDLLILFGDWG